MGDGGVLSRKGVEHDLLAQLKGWEVAIALMIYIIEQLKSIRTAEGKSVRQRTVDDDSGSNSDGEILPIGENKFVFIFCKASN